MLVPGPGRSRACGAMLVLLVLLALGAGVGAAAGGAGEPCGVYTAGCARGLRCVPRPGERAPLRALLRGEGACRAVGGRRAARNRTEPAGECAPGRARRCTRGRGAGGSGGTPRSCIVGLGGCLVAMGRTPWGLRCEDVGAPSSERYWGGGYTPRDCLGGGGSFIARAGCTFRSCIGGGGTPGYCFGEWGDTPGSFFCMAIMQG